MRWSSQARQRATLIAAHEAGVAHDICRKDRRQFSLLTRQVEFPAFLQTIVGAVGAGAIFWRGLNAAPRQRRAGPDPEGNSAAIFRIALRATT